MRDRVVVPIATLADRRELRRSARAPPILARKYARVHTRAPERDAEVCVKEHERDRLEHLARYLLRPPIALDRLKLLGPNLVCLELKRPWSDATTHVTMSPSVFPG